MNITLEYLTNKNRNVVSLMFPFSECCQYFLGEKYKYWPNNTAIFTRLVYLL